MELNWDGVDRSAVVAGGFVVKGEADEDEMMNRDVCVGDEEAVLTMNAEQLYRFYETRSRHSRQQQIRAHQGGPWWR